MRACDLPLSQGSLIPPVCLSCTVSHKQRLVSPRAVSFFPAHLLQHQSYWNCFCYSTHGMWRLSHILSREKKDNNSQQRWMGSNNFWGIYGDFLHVKFLTSTNKTSLLTSHLLQLMLRKYTVQHSATCGCRLLSGSQTKAHYHKRRIFPSVMFLFFVSI